MAIANEQRSWCTEPSHFFQNESTQCNEKEIKDLKTELEEEKTANQDLVNGLLDMNNALHELKNLLTNEL